MDRGSGGAGKVLQPQSQQVQADAIGSADVPFSTRPRCKASKGVLGRPERCEVARGFMIMWECGHERQKLAQLGWASVASS